MERERERDTPLIYLHIKKYDIACLYHLFLYVAQEFRKNTYKRLKEQCGYKFFCCSERLVQGKQQLFRWRPRRKGRGKRDEMDRKRTVRSREFYSGRV